MSLPQDRGDSKDVDVDKSSPVHTEIFFPNTEIVVDTLADTCYPGDHHHDNHTQSGPAIQRGNSEELSHYEHIEIPIDTQPGPSTEPERNLKSVYHLKATEGKQMLARDLKFREVHTRQCNFEISEEWERFQTHQGQSVSCPPSPLAGKKDSHPHAADNQAYTASEHGSDTEKTETEEPKKDKESYPFHFLFSAPQSRDKEHHIAPNPYNSLNQRFHSTLQCPCFLFFFFLCCVPAVHYMQWSDLQFKKGNNDRARRYGKMATAFYIAGSIVGIAFLSICIYFAADYVRQFVD